ncbi:MAG: molybdate ABC transporter substrate-binding protein [Gammaproteobacteria bacterium]|nr:molybdate ABC transporter substrate-binding protein [Gammaproteobacteria bacterium]
MAFPFFLILLLLCTPASGEPMNIAAASNFMAPLKAIMTDFEAHSGHKARVSFGSSGKLYAQITHGAPFDVFLSADQKTPMSLEAQGLAVKSSRFTYALGRLALWSTHASYRNKLREILITGHYQTLAIANPKLAPYGEAALQTLASLGISKDHISRLVQGENITQTFQFIHSGNANLGFIALSQAVSFKESAHGALWIIPGEYYSPIQQDVVLLKRGQPNPAARAFLAYLKSQPARAVIESFGYQLPAVAR